MSYKSNHKQASSSKNFDKSAVKAKKHLGQHFLTDHQLAQKIANSLTSSEFVLEIGPGTGILTQYILQKEVHLVAMDLDHESIMYLETDFKSKINDIKTYKSFTILESDFLKYDLTTLFSNQPFSIIGNFPYNISSQIIFKTLENRDRIPELIGMFQKEVAERICEKPGSKTYGILSVLTQAFYDTSYLFTVPPEVFNPPPNVNSAVIHITRKSNYFLACDPKLFFRVVKTAFGQRRKTLKNSLKVFNTQEIESLNDLMGKRPEQLDVETFIFITKQIQESIS